MAEQQLLDYIKQQIKEGANKKNIRSGLLQNGWANADIDGAFSILQVPTPISSVPIPPSPLMTPNLSSTAKIEDSPLANKQRRLHPRAVWLFFFKRVIAWIFLGGFFALQGAFVFSDLGKEPGEYINISFFAWFIGIFIIMMIFAYIVAKLTYHFYKYELTDSEYKAERGIIWKRYVSIPYERIQNVDIYRGVIDRLLGLSDLNIQTAGYGASGGVVAKVVVKEGYQD